jgi:hypothetical protein
MRNRWLSEDEKNGQPNPAGSGQLGSEKVLLD